VSKYPPRSTLPRSYQVGLIEEPRLPLEETYKKRGTHPPKTHSLISPSMRRRGQRKRSKKKDKEEVEEEVEEKLKCLG